jgi:subtilisin-like proprotein convertase family protein
MDEIKLKRGDREVTFKKVPDHFAVSLKQDRATDEAALAASTGRPRAKVTHVETTGPENLEVFAVEEAGELEATMDEMREAPASDVITHMYTLDDTPGGAVIPTGTMTVQFKPDVTPDARADILAEHGLEVVENLDFLPHGYTVRLTDASTENPLKIAAKLQERDDIEAAEPDLSFRISLKYVPPDALYRDQWHLRNRGDQTGLVAGADVKAEDAWEYTHKAATQGRRNKNGCVILFAAGKAVAMAAGEGEDDRLPNVLFMEHRVNVPVSDLGETEDVIPFPLDVDVREIAVNVEIKHTWRGDLRVILKTPGGEEIVLQERSGRSQDDLIRSYRSTDEPDLFASVLDASAQGSWGLRVLDMAAQDVGVLVKWGLAITY